MSISNDDNMVNNNNNSALYLNGDLPVELARQHVEELRVLEAQHREEVLLGQTYLKSVPEEILKMFKTGKKDIY